jgi:hypothetical protein
MNEAATDCKIYHNGRTYAAHCAWVDSLTGDDYRIVHMPAGYLFSFAHIAYFKHGLLNVEMTAHERLRFLNYIARCVEGFITAEAVAAIEPSCATAVQMMQELQKVPRERRMRAFEDGDVFRLLAKLNPSLLGALRLCLYHEKVPEEREGAA